MREGGGAPFLLDQKSNTAVRMIEQTNARMIIHHSPLVTYIPTYRLGSGNHRTLLIPEACVEDVHLPPSPTGLVERLFLRKCLSRRLHYVV